MADTLRLGLVSDLHWESQPDFTLHVADVDVLIAAGDILSGEDTDTAVARLEAAASGAPVLYVPGNHEFDGRTLHEAVKRLREAARGSRVRVLYRNSVDVGGVRFLGATLWSGFELFGTDLRHASEQAALSKLPDFRCIKGRTGLLSVSEVREEHRKDVAWLTKHLRRDPGVTKVMVTHFAPSRRSLQPRYARELTSAYYANPCEHLVRQAAVALHGHLHASFDYTLAGAAPNRGRVLANPLGFSSVLERAAIARESLALAYDRFPELATAEQTTIHENPAFANPLLVDIEVSTGAARVVKRSPTG